MAATLKVEYYTLLDWDMAFCYELKVVGTEVLVAIFELSGYVYLTVCRESHCCKFHLVYQT
jgi:hypothetical protein